MTTEDKLQHFLTSCISDAKDRSEQMLRDYESALQKTLSEHQTDAKNRQAQELKAAADKISRDGNKQLSMEQIELRQKFGARQDELKKKLFVEVRDMLDRFMETPAYHDLLEKQIQSAIDFAGDDEVTIYIDPVDEDQVRRLSLHHGMEIKVSNTSFFGGTRAVIRKKNVLIDNSFKRKLEDAEAEFSFDVGGNFHE